MVAYVKRQQPLEKALRGLLGEYNKTNLKREHFPVEAVAKAYLDARDLDKTVKGGMIPKTSTSRVYQLWHTISSNILPSQLPSEWAALLAGKR